LSRLETRKFEGSQHQKLKRPNPVFANMSRRKALSKMFQPMLEISAQTSQEPFQQVSSRVALGRALRWIDDFRTDSRRQLAIVITSGKKKKKKKKKMSEK
jgi:hypothetical protein